MQTFWRDLLPLFQCFVVLFWRRRHQFRPKLWHLPTKQDGGTTQKRTIFNCFKLPEVFPLVFILLQNLTCAYRITAIMFGTASLMKIHITVLSMGIDKRLFHCMNECAMVVILRTVEGFTTPLLWEGMGRRIKTGRRRCPVSDNLRSPHLPSFISSKNHYAAPRTRVQTQAESDSVFTMRSRQTV